MVDWDIGMIPDNAIPVQSFLVTLRLYETKRVDDPATGKIRLADTNVKHLKAKGKTDTELLSWAEVSQNYLVNSSQPRMQTMLSKSPKESMAKEGYQLGD
ncbi:hypothetical protein Sste5346_003711 [Sporothrix stenoceras]|uniref:Uncharacterized protein n=1 Tax=Sporothrix stenoceras TaxID=5173 RepID=A0ABR3ZEB2_9PEZI